MSKPVKKIWVKSIGNPMPMPYPETKTKPPITTPVQVVDTPAIRRLINNKLEPLVLCDGPIIAKPKKKPKEVTQ